jgi:PIN domain nuclease of toxin-antitoxin system
LNPLTGVLLDTHAAIWLVEGKLSPSSEELLVTASEGRGIFVSPISAWEIGQLACPKPGRQAILFAPDPQTWFTKLLRLPSFQLAPLTPSIAISASTLPGELHRDPADRLLIATARELGIALMTEDRAILNYANAGHIQTLRCR